GLPAVRAGPLLQIAKAAAGGLRIDPAAVVDDLHDDHVPAVEGDGDVAASGMSGGVADTLPDDGLHIGGQLTGDQAVDGSGHAHGRLETAARGLVYDVPQPPGAH